MRRVNVMRHAHCTFTALAKQFWYELRNAKIVQIAKVDTHTHICAFTLRTAQKEDIRSENAGIRIVAWHSSTTHPFSEVPNRIPRNRELGIGSRDVKLKYYIYVIHFGSCHLYAVVFVYVFLSRLCKLCSFNTFISTLFIHFVQNHCIGNVALRCGFTHKYTHCERERERERETPTHTT